MKERCHLTHSDWAGQASHSTQWLTFVEVWKGAEMSPLEPPDTRPKRIDTDQALHSDETPSGASASPDRQLTRLSFTLSKAGTAWEWQMKAK